MCLTTGGHTKMIKCLLTYQQVQMPQNLTFISVTCFSVTSLVQHSTYIYTYRYTRLLHTHIVCLSVKIFCFLNWFITVLVLSLCLLLERTISMNKFQTNVGQKSEGCRTFLPICLDFLQHSSMVEAFSTIHLDFYLSVDLSIQLVSMYLLMSVHFFYSVQL